MGMDTFGLQAEHTKERCVTAAVDFITWPSRLMLHCGYGPRAGMGDDTYAEARMEHLLWRNGAAAAPRDLGFKRYPIRQVLEYFYEYPFV